VSGKRNIQKTCALYAVTLSVEKKTQNDKSSKSSFKCHTHLATRQGTSIPVTVF